MSTENWAERYAHVTHISCMIPISAEILDPTLIQRPPLTRRARLRYWRNRTFSAYALRSRLAHWLDPDPYKDER